MPALRPARAARLTLPVRCALLGSLLLLASCATISRLPSVESPDMTGRVDFRDIERFTRFYRVMRYENDEAIWRAVSPSYDEFSVVDVPQTRNRYMIGTSDAARRQDIWIRGTANLRNAGFDMEYGLHHNDSLGIDLHKGFEEITLTLYRSILPRLKADYALVIFGHSLGAAEAEILAMLLSRDNFHVAQVYASGAPRVTTARGAAAYEYLPILRIVNPGDPVPFLPPRDIISARDPYTHLGATLVLLDGPWYCLLAPGLGDGWVGDALWPWAAHETLGRQVTMHLVPAYLARLRPKLDVAIQVSFADRAAFLPPPEPDPSQGPAFDRGRFGR